MKALLALVVCGLLYLQLLPPLVAHMEARPFVQKLGYVPQENLMRLAAADQKQFSAATLVFRTMMYFGGLIHEATTDKIHIPPDYDGMAQNIKTAVKLDPYNMDGYYFAQAILTWDTGRIREANEVLEYGMRYRDWDFYLPFFAGFNYAYFLKDYDKAARYYQRAAELTGAELFVNLTSRYLYQSRQTDLAIGYLKTMQKTARNAAVRETFRVRLQALEEVKRIEVALEKYRQAQRQGLPTVEQLVREGYLSPPPADPYGGRFFITREGEVQTTSKLAFAGAKHEGNRNR